MLNPHTLLLAHRQTITMNVEVAVMRNTPAAAPIITGRLIGGSTEPGEDVVGDGGLVAVDGVVDCVTSQAPGVV